MKMEKFIRFIVIQIIFNFERGEKMKEVYLKPQAEVSEFETVDVITTSGYGGNDTEWELPE